MKNLEQIRAAHAIHCAKDLDRAAICKLPALLIANGFLAAAAFSLDSESRAGMLQVWAEVARHLQQTGHLHAPPANPAVKEQVEFMLKTLADKSSFELQRASSETLAYLGYLKRFAPKKTK